MDGTRVPSAIDIAFQKRPGAEELSCCSVNAARGFGMVGDWALLSDGREGLVLNWYGPSTMSATAAGGMRVTLTQATDYPRGGRIRLRVEPEKPARFALKLRVPHWSARTAIRVNGGAPLENVRAGTYCRIEREWRARDEVEIELDMALRYWVGERRVAGKVSLYRGPVLLAYERGGRGRPPATKAAMPGNAIEARPALDITRLSPRLLDDAAATGGPMVRVEVAGADGEMVTLIDYGSAGQDGRAYETWLAVRRNLPPMAFTRENPTRSARCGD
jgi:uncharacterized protein